MRGIGNRSVFVVHRRRSAGKDDSDWRVAANLLQRSIARKYYGKNILFPDAARDELRILRAKVEDNEDCRAGLGFHG